MNNCLLFFIKTDDLCKIHGVSYPGIPIFFDEGGIIECLSDYMIYLRRTKGHPESTVETYAYHLQKYFKFLRTIEMESGYVDWRDVTDQILIGWRDKMLHIEKILDCTASLYLCTIFDFYLWAEKNARVKNCVASREHDGLDDKVYKIAATRTKRGGWVWPYLPKVQHRPDRNTPTPDQLELVHVNAFEKLQTGQRDSLILSLYEDLGLRRIEALRLTVNDIPSWDEIDEAFAEDRPFIVAILGKTGKTRYVPALPEVMQRAREYIEGERSDAIARAKIRNSAYQPPAALLIGHTTGNELNPQYLSNRLSGLLRISGIEDASGHRIRATYIETQVEASDGYDQSGRPLPAEQVMWKVGERVGHSNPRSTRPYLNKVRARSYATIGDQILDKTFKLNDIRRQLAQKLSTLNQVEQLREIADALRTGRAEEAENLLMELLKSWPSRAQKIEPGADIG